MNFWYTSLFSTSLEVPIVRFIWIWLAFGCFPSFIYVIFFCSFTYPKKNLIRNVLDCSISWSMDLLKETMFMLGCKAKGLVLWGLLVVHSFFFSFLLVILIYFVFSLSNQSYPSFFLQILTFTWIVSCEKRKMDTRGTDIIFCF